MQKDRRLHLVKAGRDREWKVAAAAAEEEAREVDGWEEQRLQRRCGEGGSEGAAKVAAKAGKLHLRGTD